MDPNSRNQRWSRWKFYIVPGWTKRPTYADVKENTARFAKKAFGSATEMNISQGVLYWTVDVRTEGHPAHDPTFVKFYEDNFRKFFVNGFGVGTRVKLSVKIEAGHKDDGKPADQLVMLPTLKLEL